MGVCFVYPALCVADKQSKNGLVKFSVKFFLHSSGNIAAKFQYDQVLLTKLLAEVLIFLFNFESFTNMPLSLFDHIQVSM